MREKEMKFIGQVMLEVIDLIKKYRLPEKKEERKEYIASFEREMRASDKIKEIHLKVKKVALGFPIP